MKTKYPSIFGILAIFMLVASLVVPANLASPTTAEAGFDAGICKWDTLEMPNSQVGRWDILAQSEIDKLVVAPDDNTLLAAVSLNGTAYGWGGNPVLMVGGMKGINWDYTQQVHLVSDMDRKYPNIPAAGVTGGRHSVFDVACAPDDASFWAVVTSGNQTAANVAGWANAPVEVWITEDAGSNWECTNLAASTSLVAGSAYIGALDISPDYGGKRDIAVGLREGNGNEAFSIWVLPSTGFTGWNLQTLLPDGVTIGDVLDLKFSPTYVGDASLAVVYADGTNTYFDVAQRDLANNDITNWSGSYEVCGTVANASPSATQIITADLELPSDFSGQSASLRRAYVSTYDSQTTNPGGDGIFRVDDTTVYTLMDCGTTPTDGKNIATIAYYGTYASGKLLAGEVKGDSCAATVPTWFTDSPTTCPIPCWYPALKPTTGAAGTYNCATPGNGNAQVAWSVTGELAYVGTGSVLLDGGAGWWEAFFAPNGVLGSLGTPYDETAFAISRNNGETWNQLGMIDTNITKFNDVAPSADCNTIYLASLNNIDATGLAEALGPSVSKCWGFDSVWRTSVNSAVTSPLIGILPLGFYYERVYCRPTAPSCAYDQTNLPLLRLAPAPDNEDGEIVFWAAQDPDATLNSGVAAWSPDFGDYWANINPRNPVQDFVAASNTLLYVLSPAGMVQKMPYTGTAWSSIEADVYSGAVGHMIATYGEDKILVGYDVAATYPGGISTNGGATFDTLFALMPTDGNAHVAFHPDYADNGIFFLADDNDTGANRGSVYRNTYIGLMGNSWSDGDMMAISNTAYGCPDFQAHNVGQFGLQLATTGADNDYALYSAHGAGTILDLTDPAEAGDTVAISSGVERTLWPLWGMPKPGMFWDCLDQNLATGVLFTLEPWSLKKCGCLTADTDTKLWALDDRAYSPTWKGAGTLGYLWGFADCMAKAGPELITEDGALIGCDVVSGRAQEVDLRWEQLCVANNYDIEIGKDANFTIKVIDWVEFTACSGFFAPEVSLAPAAYIPAGGLATYGAASEIATSGNLECGHTYYWKVEVRQCATGQIIRSPWSEVRSFTVKAGLPVSADYYGLKLLSPDNGCIGCPTSPVSFSWSPFKDTTKYKFVLAKDAALTDVLAEAETATTAYEYDGTLDYSTNYFWRVMCVEPAPSDWSATFSFQTEAAPAAPELPPEAPATPAWVWIIIALGAILVIVTLVLIFKTRRV